MDGKKERKMKKEEPLLIEWETIRDAGHDLFFAVLEKDPFIYDPTTNMPVNCYWCTPHASYESYTDLSTWSFEHEDDCLWKRVQDFFQEIK